MSTNIGIVNYGLAGNIFNIIKAVEKAGGKAKVIEKENDFKNVDKLILPGVGSFKDAMEEIASLKFKDILQEELTKKDTLGICLGMQILANLGFEYGHTEGLGIINAEVKKILCEGSVPHMGFNSIKPTRSSLLLHGIEEEKFYFMHSYEVVNYTDILALSEYENHTFVSAVEKDNVYGVQFHPEKSRDAGIQLFQNFFKL
jgi:imidazole glycerol phosphate synthase glutamine amidotransferase subunit